VYPDLEIMEHGLRVGTGNKYAPLSEEGLDIGSLHKLLKLKPDEHIQGLRKTANGNISVLIASNGGEGLRWKSTILSQLDLLNPRRT